MRASVELQRRLRTGTEEVAFPLGVGMGLDAGEAVRTHGGYRGAPLNLAARLCSSAGPGQILASEGAVHLAQRVPDVAYSQPRVVRVKGIDEPVRIVGVLPTESLPAVPLQAPAARGRRRRPGRRTWAAVAMCGLIGVAAVLGWIRANRTAAAVPVRGDTIAILDPANDHVVGDVQVGAAPLAIAAGFGARWTANSGDQSVSRVSLQTKRRRIINVRTNPAVSAVGEGSVWAYDGGPGRVCQIDKAGSRQPVSTYRLPSCCALGCVGIAAGYHRVWVSDGGTDVYTLNWRAHSASFEPLPGLPNPANAVTIGNGYVYSVAVAVGLDAEDAPLLMHQPAE